jgi:thiamine-monophosphate kinase
MSEAKGDAKGEPKGEWALVDWIRRQITLDPEAFPIGPGDDMAQVNLGGESRCLVTVDALLEGTHFDLKTATPRQVGYKALAVSLSDAAAMAALPVCAVAWVSLPKGRDMAFAEELNQGLYEAATKFACPIVGGDITSWDKPLTIGTALIARSAGVKPVRRNGAKPGDFLFVTGTLGGSLLGRHLAFVPRVAEARKLAAVVSLHAMIDLSDGLSTDLHHLCRESGVAAEIEAEAIPVTEDAAATAKHNRHTPLWHALNDGEDFELLLAVDPSDRDELVAKNPIDPLKLTCVGKVVEGMGVTLVQKDGSREPLAPGGWEHFK